jgi:hypothetical protein
MTAFKAFLVVAWVGLVAYTGVVIYAHGLDLLPIFFGDIAKMGWPGQFNLDFSCFLMLSALWTAWRNGFSVTGLILGLLALVGGAGFLLLYLFVLTVQSRGDVAYLLLGPARARRS